MWQRNRAKRPEGFLPKKSEDEKAKSCQPSKKRSREVRQLISCPYRVVVKGASCYMEFLVFGGVIIFVILESLHERSPLPLDLSRV